MHCITKNCTVDKKILKMFKHVNSIFFFLAIVLPIVLCQSDSSTTAAPEQTTAAPEQTTAAETTTKTPIPTNTTPPKGNKLLLILSITNN